VALAIIAAGGGGQRLGSASAKFQVPLLGKPMVYYSLRAFEEAPSIDSIVLVVPGAFVQEWSVRVLRESGTSKAATTVAGGATRQESVRLGLEAGGSPDGIVVVHDAARPLVTAEMIQAVCAIGDGLAGMITAVPVTDTIKRVEGGQVIETVERAGLYSAQTPQGFVLSALIEAHRDAARAGFEGTDDAMLVERCGGRVGVVAGSRDNIKVTYPADVATAEAALKGRQA
jgi:2-C-methyl-D-erythritol 4-phosphate cytidylyltransferase